jgi:sensor histidine kinase regulating citrate/malate metabolism
MSRSQLCKIRKLQACSDKQDSYVHGFGLRVAFACAANMGAKLTVQSQEGQGTTFGLKLGSNKQA